MALAMTVAATKIQLLHESSHPSVQKEGADIAHEGEDASAPEDACPT